MSNVQIYSSYKKVNMNFEFRAPPVSAVPPAIIGYERPYAKKIYLVTKNYIQSKYVYEACPCGPYVAGSP
jgi:hypothetical protein